MLTEFAKEAKAEKCGEDGYCLTPAVLFVCRRELFQARFTPREIKAFAQALGACITDTEQCAAYTGFFLSLLDFINSHAVDLDNALLGMTVSPSIADILHEDERTRDSVSSEEITKDVLLSRIMCWGAEQSDSVIAENVRSFCSLLPSSMQTFKRGDLVALAKSNIVNTFIATLDLLNDPAIVFARCMSDYSYDSRESKQSVLVTCDPLERTAFELPLEKVMVLPYNVKRAVLTSKPSAVTWDQYAAAQSFAEHTAETLILDRRGLLGTTNEAAWC